MSQTKFNISHVSLTQNYTVIGPQKSSGPWDRYSIDVSKANDRCFEFKWKGGSGHYVIGFLSNNNYGVYYLHEHETAGISQTINYKFSPDSELLRINNDIQSSVDEWLMLCISHKRRTFSIVGQEKTFVSTFAENFYPNNKFSVYFGQGQSGKASDDIEINFGFIPFRNVMPLNYLSWAASVHSKCQNKDELNLPFLFCLSLTYLT